MNNQFIYHDYPDLIVYTETKSPDTHLKNLFNKILDKEIRTSAVTVDYEEDKGVGKFTYGAVRLSNYIFLAKSISKFSYESSNYVCLSSSYAQREEAVIKQVMPSIHSFNVILPMISFFDCASYVKRKKKEFQENIKNYEVKIFFIYNTTINYVYSVIYYEVRQDSSASTSYSSFKINILDINAFDFDNKISNVFVCNHKPNKYRIIVSNYLLDSGRSKVDYHKQDHYNSRNRTYYGGGAGYSTGRYVKKIKNIEIKKLKFLIDATPKMQKSVIKKTKEVEEWEYNGEYSGGYI